LRASRAASEGTLALAGTRRAVVSQPYVRDGFRVFFAYVYSFGVGFLLSPCLFGVP
jgi:hypothetical protein